MAKPPADSAKSRGATFEEGLANRKNVLGVEHVQRSLAESRPVRDAVAGLHHPHRMGRDLGRSDVPWKTRSMVTLAMMVALHREEEFKLHVRPALKNGVTLEELRSLLIQAAIYAGVPAANAAFRWVSEVLGDELT